ncbi:MAG: DUF6512 family protein [Leucobacter sp.]
MNVDSIITVSWWMILPLGIIGSLLHFLFDWTGHNRVAAIFSAVNESYWERIKIAVWPVVVLHVALFAAGGYQHPSFLPASTIALYSIPISMIGLIFLYKAITKRNVLWLDITVFFIVIAIAQAIFVLILGDLAASTAMIVLSSLFFVGLLAAFSRFTFRPPREPDVFVDPLNQKYGLRAHPDLDAEERMRH